MTPEQAIQEIEKGTLRPVYLLVGDERYLRNQVLNALTTAYQKKAIAGLNEDDFSVPEASAAAVLTAAKTLPMMSERRWVLVRDIDRWEGKEDSTGKEKKGRSTTPLDDIASYAEAPSVSTLLILCADKLDARRRLFTLAKKQDFLVKCDAIPAKMVPAWARDAAKRRGRKLAPSAAELITEVLGTDLSMIDDLIERLSLYVSADVEISEEHIGELIPVVRPSTVWKLVDALGQGRYAEALASLSKVYDPDDRGLRLLGVIAWSTRQLIRFRAARAAGKSPEQAAIAAGARPFKARELDAQVRRAAPGQFERWLGLLRTIDLELKGGSKRSPRAILEAAVLDLCRNEAATALPSSVDSAPQHKRDRAREY